ncbi:hypothetical protein BU24DRAFT_287630 [Aaosphaeria arxii CBS 175.79]|uniref:Uncharacterized protein n=1 Tax=Aaosphaeria arxii CBS 175.79 TaxID=1450172 RepID=A0A6A5XFW2_9PLEO|nr:uncharacterized protein BU24DRAFT_287630 [Aaosphaeria arxii CBS 175.79]KAF2011717.1 hypothetical protein BU24DRAFT_287630 [Aaosphaeria arxii CBS 175.79]
MEEGRSIGAQSVQLHTFDTLISPLIGPSSRLSMVWCMVKMTYCSRQTMPHSKYCMYATSHTTTLQYAYNRLHTIDYTMYVCTMYTMHIQPETCGVHSRSPHAMPCLPSSICRTTIVLSTSCPSTTVPPSLVSIHACLKTLNDNGTSIHPSIHPSKCGIASGSAAAPIRNGITHQLHMRSTPHAYMASTQYASMEPDSISSS